ncbi:MAG: TetR/AcrR family transcriptional regulator, partial [Oscillospiraceae bacterium]|nr:TetR/AcrR family transcriptional regulator [Oscillospiraceae bacterium]
MPPRSKVTREMIVDAAMETAREAGAGAINARTVARRLRCSTQPVMYHFATMEELKRAVYDRADQFHSDYLMRSAGDIDPLLGIGLNYIRFAIEEPHLFRFLFESGYARQNNLPEMIGAEELAPVLEAVQAGTGLDREKTGEVFPTLAMFTHGYASIIANN